MDNNIKRGRDGRFLKNNMLGKTLSEETKAKMSLAKQGTRNSFYGKHHSEETKKKMSLSHKDISDEVRKNMSLSRMGVKNHFYGKHHSEETKRKLRGRVFTEEWRKNMSLSHKGQRATSGAFKKGHIPWIKGKTNVYSEETLTKIRNARAKQKLPLKDTKPERMMQITLALNGIEFKKHRLIQDKKIGFYHQVDLFIEPNICIEVDGDYWHKRPENIIRDTIVNHRLGLMGYFLIRLWEKDIKKNTQECAENIIKMIKERMEVERS